MKSECDTDDLRPFETWTINYVRKMIRAERITKDQALEFVGVWNSGVGCNSVNRDLDRLTVDELYKGK